MRKVEELFFFIGCLVVCYFVCGCMDGLLGAVFHFTDNYVSGFFMGGSVIGSMVFCYRNRKHRKNFVQSC